MKRLAILGIIACVGLLVGSASVIGGPTGPPGGLDVAVVNPIPLPVTGSVNVSTVYRFVGVTEATTDGGAGGILGMNSLCQADSRFPANSRMCTYEEFIQSPVTSGVGSGRPWINPSIISATETGESPSRKTIYIIYPGVAYAYDEAWVDSPYSPANLPCQQWTSRFEGFSGWTLQPEGSLTARTECDAEHPVACCAPAAQIP